MSNYHVTKDKRRNCLRRVKGLKGGAILGEHAKPGWLSDIIFVTKFYNF
jgi:hypothetical protein